MWERKATRVILSYVVPKAQLFLFSSSQLEEFVYMEMKRKRTLFFQNQMLFPLDLQNNKTVWPNWKSFRLSCETLFFLFRLFPTSYYWFGVAGIQLFCFIFRRVIRLTKLKVISSLLRDSIVPFGSHILLLIWSFIFLFYFSSGYSLVFRVTRVKSCGGSWKVYLAIPNATVVNLLQVDSIFVATLWKSEVGDWLCLVPVPFQAPCGGLLRAVCH